MNHSKIYLAWVVALGFALARLVLALRLDLYADEAFYYQCSLRPALAYADLPPLTALTVKAGVALWGANPFGVRFFFFLIGLVTPLAMFALAKNQTTRPQALAAAGLIFVIPGFGFLGVLAIPDVLLGLETVLFLYFFERATRTEETRSWACLGIVAGLGLLTHYRFSTSLLACLLYMFLTQRGRQLLRKPGIWIAGLVALPGLLPGLIYNLQNQGAPLRYFLMTRHDTHWQSEAWLQHILEQMGAISPVLWVFALGTLFHLVNLAVRGDDRAKLFSLFALLPLALYFLAAPLQTTGAQSFHWSLPGFVPLIIFLPKVLVNFATKFPKPPWRRWLVLAGPGIAVTMLAIAYAELGIGQWRIPGFREPFTGWREAVAATQVELEKLEAQGVAPAGIVADNYKLGAQLELSLNTDLPIYILDHSKNYEHGRQRQFNYWDRGEVALRRMVGKEVLVAVQWSELATNRERWQKHLHWYFQPLQALGQFHYSDGSGSKYDKKITFYRATVIEKK